MAGISSLGMPAMKGRPTRPSNPLAAGGSGAMKPAMAGTGQGTNASAWEANITEGRRVSELLGQPQSSPPPSYGNPDQSMPPSMSALTGGAAPPDYTREDMLRNERYGREDRMRLEDQSRRDQMFQRIQGMYGADSPTISRTDGPSAEQEEAVRARAFASAKEKTAQTARASMTALQGVVDGSGMMGSSMHAAQAGNVVGGAGGGINDFLREQATSEADHATGIADTEYQGQIAQRGQDMSRKQAMLQLLSQGGLY